MSPTTFCYCCSQVKETTMLECMKCKKLFHFGCLKSGKPSCLEGDGFFDFRCSGCSPTGEEEVKRMKLPWLQVVSLSLYNLHLTAPGKKGFFRWKEHICAFIDKHWTTLFGVTRKKTTTWHGTVAGTLSSGCPQYFRSGAQELKESGWWRATEIKAPTMEADTKTRSTRSVRMFKVESPNPKVEGLRDRRNKTSIQAAIELKAKRCSTQEAKDIRKKKAAELATSPLCMPFVPMVFPSHSAIKQEPLSPGEMTADSMEPPEELSEQKPEDGNVDLFSNPVPVKKEVFSAEDLIPTERVPMLLLAGDKDMESDSDMEVDPCSYTPTVSPINMSNDQNMEDILASLDDHSPSISRENFSADISDITPATFNDDSNFPTEVDSVMSEDRQSLGDSSELDGGKDAPDTTDDKKRKSEEEEREGKEDRNVQAECVPLSIYEEKQLLKKLTSFGDIVFSKPELNRLRRKLLVRQVKRERGLPIFDLDTHIQQIIGIEEKNAKVSMMQDAINRWNVYNVPSSQPSTDHRVLDRFQCALPTVKTASLQKITFQNRLVGFTDDQLQSICSPYTARMLKPFIRRDYESRPLKMRLLQEIISYPHRKDKHWQPPPMPPIDYCYVRPEHIPSLNLLCREFFWPGIELSECLQYPDFSCVVLYRKIVIGFAFMVPDVKYNEAYISFIFTHPEWRFAGIAKFMVYHLIQTCMGKDVTLHVSPTNPAMMLYQKFGFKPEEFILDFYEKYYPYDSKECRHAFFLRLRR